TTQKRTKIIDWLSPISFFPRQADIARVRQPGTGEWCLQNVECPRGTLWCRGRLGAGKTVLASMVVEHLITKSKRQNIGVACIYLNHKETHVHSPLNLLASIWRQLVFDRYISYLAQKLYEANFEKGTRPSLEEIQAVLFSVVTDWVKVYVVVDALDEYPEDERHILLENLAVMGPTVNVMLTSRSHISLSTPIPNLGIIEIRANEKDVQKYLDEQIRLSPRLLKHVNLDQGYEMKFSQA
ncbi:hypothetical protein B0H17DRAFT_944103, partial [Mycena rosella]